MLITRCSCEAACLAEMQSNGEKIEGQTDLNAMMAEVPKNLKKIAGKSLPIEVCHNLSLNTIWECSVDSFFSEIRVTQSEEIRNSEP